MNHVPNRFRNYVPTLGAVLVAAATIGAQPPQKPALTASDYGKWESLDAGELSPDGHWLAVPVRRVDGTRELRLYDLRSPGTPIVVDEGSHPRFSDDSRWLAGEVGYPETIRRQKEKDSEPIRNKMALVRLEDVHVEVVENVRRFDFGNDGAHLAFHKYPREEGDEGDEESESLEEPEEREPSADLIVRLLADGSEVHFGSVSGFAWQDEGGLLAFTIDADDRSGNGVELYDASRGTLRVLDSGDGLFSGLAWRKDEDDLAALRTRSDDGREGASQVLLAWRDLSGEGQGFVYDHLSDDAFPGGIRLASDPPPAWSDDGETLFFGIKEWRERPEESGEENGEENGTDTEPDLDPSGVQVWHSLDERIFPMQQLQKDDDRKRSFLSAWHLEAGRFVQLGIDLYETVTVLEGHRFAAETDRRPYRFDNQFDRARRDVHLIDVTSGERRKAIDGTWYFEGGSATGRYLLYFEDDQHWAYDIDEDRHVSLTRDLKASFVNDDYDTPVRKQKPPWGVAGGLASDTAVLLYDKYDLWSVRPDGTGGTRLTAGASEEVRHRYVELDEEAESIAPEKPLFLSVYGYRTKKSGYARLLLAGAEAASAERLVWKDERVDRLTKAEDTNVFAYVRQDFDDSPDYFVSSATFANAKRVTATNTFQADYAWGRSELVDFENERGEPLQGALFYPAGYQTGRAYPMIVYIYEKRSQVVHNYVAPTERQPYNPSVFTQQGYFVFQPDIVYRDRDPGVSAVECVVPAVTKVLETGMIDPEHVGLVGHSWGGYEASYIPTRTRIFAASVAGAPLTNFFSMFGTVHWNQGNPETSHFETGQARMDVPYWDDMDAYVRNSPVMFIRELETPMLIFFGDKDGTVDWHQGVELYNYARRAGKELVMLVYPGENHSARQPENQIDYHHRVLQWFGHYLKGDDAPEWMTRGVTALEREREMKR